MRTLTTEQAAYWAGVIDGEGCLSIYRSKGKRGGCTARIHVANTKREWLEQLQAEIDAGKLTTPRANGPLVNAKHLSDLWFNRPEMEALLPQVRPFLRMKGQQADLLAQYFVVTDAMRSEHFKRDGETYARLRSERDSIVAQVRVLNQRGTGIPRAAQPKQAFRKCGLTSCGGQYFCKGYCRKHYRLYVERGGPTWVERACSKCGKPFVARTKQQEFCSHKCNHSAWMAAHRVEQNAAQKRRRHQKRSPT